MSDIENIRFLWRYMAHADRQVAAAVSTVAESGFIQPQEISFGSIQKLIGHTITAQNVWLRRLNGEDVAYAEEPLPSLEDFSERWEAVDGELLKFANAQSADSAQRLIRSRNRSGTRFEFPVWTVMLHVADHATYHRGQLNSMIKRAGGTPSPVMVYTYAVGEGIARQL